MDRIEKEYKSKEKEKGVLTGFNLKTLFELLLTRPIQSLHIVLYYHVTDAQFVYVCVPDTCVYIDSLISTFK